MTPQEQEMIDGLITRIRGTSVQNKDTAAEQRLQQGLAGYPDSTYVLAQTVLVQQYGLQQAQAQLEDLKQQNAALQDQLQQVQQAHEQAKSSGGSFLSHIFGSGSSQSASSQSAPPTTNTGYQTVNSSNYTPQGAPTQSYPGGSYPPPQGNYPPAGYPTPSGGGMFGGGGFLQGAMRTAAGVAAGEIAFRGIEDLFHGFGGGGERGFTGMGGVSGGETVVNNYYDDGGSARGGDRDSGSFYNPSDDASRSNAGDGAQFADAGNDEGSFGDSGDNNSGFDDSSSFDDSGNDDSSV